MTNSLHLASDLLDVVPDLPARTLLTLTAEVENIVARERRDAEGVAAEANSTANVVHNILVDVALRSDKIKAFMVAGQKINAIKELRTITGLGLKPCKEAIEDDRVSNV